MKQKLKLLFNLTLAGILLFSCQVEKDFTNDSIYKTLKIEHKKFEDLIQEPQFRIAYETITKSKRGSFNKGNASSKTVMENQYGFTIASLPANIITTDTLVSYTFLITRPNTPNTIFENLIVNTRPNKETKAYIFKCESTTSFDDVPFNIKTFSGKKILYPIDYDVAQANTRMFTERCDLFLTWQCNGVGHTAPGPECTAGGWIEANGGSEPICVTTASMYIPGSDGPNANTGGPQPTNNNYSGGSNGNGFNTPVTTYPVPPCTRNCATINNIPPNPCSELKKKSLDNVFVNKTKFLKQPNILSLSHESGFARSKVNGVLQFITLAHGSSSEGSHCIIPENLYTTEVLHNHQNDIDLGGGSTRIMIKMFSPTDIYFFTNDMMYNAEVNNTPPSENINIMVSAYGTFALKMLTNTVDINLVNFETMTTEYLKKCEALIKKNNLNATSTQIVLLDILKEYGLQNAVGLYEATDDNLTNWNRKIIDANGILTPIPCIN